MNETNLYSPKYMAVSINQRNENKITRGNERNNEQRTTEKVTYYSSKRGFHTPF